MPSPHVTNDRRHPPEWLKFSVPVVVTVVLSVTGVIVLGSQFKGEVTTKIGAIGNEISDLKPRMRAAERIATEHQVLLPLVRQQLDDIRAEQAEQRKILRRIEQSIVSDAVGGRPN